MSVCLSGRKWLLNLKQTYYCKIKENKSLNRRFVAKKIRKSHLRFSDLFTYFFRRAINGIRTRDPQLGKLNLLRLLKAVSFKINQPSYYRLRESFIIIQIESEFLVVITVDTNRSNNADVNNELKFSFGYSSPFENNSFQYKFIYFLDINNIQESNNAFTSFFKIGIWLITIFHIVSG